MTVAPWPDATEIDTGVPLEQSVQRALQVIHPPEHAAAWRFLRSRMEPG